MGGGGINKINSLSFVVNIYFCYLNLNYLIPNVDWQADFLIRCRMMIFLNVIFKSEAEASN